MDRADGLDGSEPVSLGITNVSPQDIIWSPDGTMVASVVSDDAGNADSFRVIATDVNGGGPTYIDTPDMVGGPSWQPVFPTSS